MMSYVDYSKWAKYILRIVEKAGIEKGIIIDLSFGTGLFWNHWYNPDLKRIGADISLPMLRQYKNAKTVGKPNLVNNDICNIAFKDNIADVMLSLYDAINYLNTRFKLRAAFSDVNRVLKPGGYFIFDMVTRRLCEKYFSNYQDIIKVGDAEIIRKSVYNPSKSLQFNHFMIKKNGVLSKERHIQKIYTIAEMQQAIEKANLQILYAYHGLGFRKPSEKSERIHFVCKKLLE